MGLKKTILRFSQVFEQQYQSVINENFKNNLKTIIGDFEIETYPLLADLKRSYQRRIDSLYKAFLLIMDVIPMRQDDDLSRIMDCREFAHRSMSFDDCLVLADYQKKLVSYTSDLINTILAYYIWPEDRAVNRHQFIIALLNKADLYVIMQEGRANLATLIQIDMDDVATSSSSSQAHWLLLHDKQHFPFCEQTMEELQRIKAGAEPFLTPSWFRQLTSPIQSYFCKAENLSTDISFLKIQLNILLMEWKRQRQARQYIIQGDLELIAIDQDITRLPDWFRCLSKEQQQMVKQLVHPKITQNDFEKRLNQLGDAFTSIAAHHMHGFIAQLSSLQSLPYWYLLLEVDEQRLLNYSLRKIENIYDAVSFLSSRLRTLPGLSNLAEHSIVFLDQQGLIIESFPSRVRSSHIVSRGVLDLPEEIMQLHAKRNLDHVLRFGPDKPALIQTLISPDRFTYTLTGMPDYPLYHRLSQTIKASGHSQRIFYPNHPYNLARVVYFTHPEDPECCALLDYAQRFYSSAYDHVNSDQSRGLLSEEELNDLQFLIDEYRNVLNSEAGSATWHELWAQKGRELHLSALEQLLIFKCSGLPYSSCVSGKDRNWINIAYTDAMVSYRYLYGKWYSFQNGPLERKRFMTILGTIIISRHGDEHAGQNAPGAEGIKHAKDYMPGEGPEIIRGLLGLTPAHPCPLIIADKLASNNDVDEIIASSSMSNPDMPKYEIAAQKLSESSRGQFLDLLRSILKQEEFWLQQRKNRFYLQSHLTSPSPPRGIDALNKILAESDRLNSMTLLARIYQSVEKRPLNDELRTMATSQLYTAILRLLNAVNPEDVLAEVLEQISSINAYTAASSSDLGPC